jgi:hypothetical protein
MEDIKRKLTTWRVEASSSRNDGWVQAHYKNLIREVYLASKKIAEDLSLIEDAVEEEQESAAWLPFTITQ